MSTEGNAPVPGARQPAASRTEFPEDSYRDPAASDRNRLRDPVRWSSVWAGLVVAIAIFILLELVFFAFGWLRFGQDASTTVGWVTAIIGLLSFFMGGLIAGATSIWNGAREGAVHGLLVWSLGVVGILFLALLGGGALFGSAATVFTELGAMQRPEITDDDLNQALRAAQDSAGWAVLGLFVYLLAAAVGGACGVKMGSGKESAMRPPRDDRQD